MTLCKNKQIHNCCLPNALMTLKEYLIDYASEKTKKAGENLIQHELLNIPNKITQEHTKKYLNEITNGMRDFRF